MKHKRELTSALSVEVVLLRSSPTFFAVRFYVTYEHKINNKQPSNTLNIK